MDDIETQPERDFVQMFVEWREETSGTVQQFVAMLAERFGESVGELMSDSEFQEICVLGGVDYSEAEEILMSHAWP